MHSDDIKGTMDTATLAEKTFASLMAGLQHLTDPSDTLKEEVADLAWMRLLIVNVTFVGLPNSRWVLVDAGLPGSATAILRAAQRRFGSRRPEAIILTHGHFDHVGSIKELLQKWDVPVYAHPEELPFLRGEADYT